MKSKILSTIWNNFTEALFPSGIACIICNTDLKHENKYSICDKCLKALPYNNGKVCLKCGEQIESLADYCLNCKSDQQRYFTVARAPLLYDGEVKALIHGLKYNHKKYIGEYMGEFLVDEYIKNNFKADIIVPIPLNKNRFKQREYNQAEVICHALTEKLNLSLNLDNFIRTIDTPTQTELSKQERKQNLSSVFKVLDKSVFKDKIILLVDDVYTTGATMEEASHTLLDAGAKSVIALSVAHTLPSYKRNKK